MVESRDLGPDPGDQVLLEWAIKQSRILVTIDTDFGTLVYRDKSPHCGIVRLPDSPARQRIELMEQILKAHGRDLERGAVITVKRKFIRVSKGEEE